MDSLIKKKRQRLKRKKGIRKDIFGTAECPRMSVYRSLTNCYVQLIDDSAHKTVLGVSTMDKQFCEMSEKKRTVEASKILGAIVAERALGMNIKKIKFDRNGFKYHGRVKAVAEGAREKGLQF